MKQNHYMNNTNDNMYEYNRQVENVIDINTHDISADEKFADIYQDHELTNLDEDYFEFNDYLNEFFEKYVESSYSGSVLINGKWGKGKTSFLNLLINKINAYKIKKYKIVRVPAWRDFNDKTIYSKLLLEQNKLLYFLPHIILALVFLITSLIQFFMNYTKLFSAFNLTLFTIVFFILIFTITTYLTDNITKEQFDKKILIRLLNRKNLNKIIFIVDDLDRLDKESRLNIYSLISELKDMKKALVINVGNYQILENDIDDEVFLQKVINEIFHLPPSVNSENIWDEFILNKFFKSRNNIRIYPGDEEDLKSIKEIFIRENRTIREAKHLLNTFNNLYSDQNNKEVNAGQQLVIAYLYRFHQRFYIELTQQWNEIKSYWNPKFQIFDVEEFEKFKTLMNGQFSEELYKFLVSTLKVENSSYNYPNMQISNNIFRYFYNYLPREKHLTITLDEVQGLFEKNPSDVKLLKNFIKSHNKDFIYLLQKNYLEKNTLSKEFEKSYIKIFESLAIIYAEEKTLNSNNVLVETSNSLFRKIRNVLFEFLEKSPHEVFKYISNISSLDLSSKLTLLPIIIPKVSNSNDQLNELINLLQSSKKIKIYNQKNPKSIFIFISTYRKQLLNIKYDLSFDELFELDEDEFYNFVKKKLTTELSDGQIKIEDFILQVENTFIKNFYLYVENMNDKNKSQEIFQWIRNQEKNII